MCNKTQGQPDTVSLAFFLSFFLCLYLYLSLSLTQKVSLSLYSASRYFRSAGKDGNEKVSKVAVKYQSLMSFISVTNFIVTKVVLENFCRLFLPIFLQIFSPIFFCFDVHLTIVDTITVPWNNWIKF